MEIESMRERATELFGDEVAGALGPFPDEVGWPLSAIALVVKCGAIAALFWGLIDLVLPRRVGDMLAQSLVVTGIALIALAWLTPDKH